MPSPLPSPAANVESVPMKLPVIVTDWPVLVTLIPCDWKRVIVTFVTLLAPGVPVNRSPFTLPARAPSIRGPGRALADHAHVGERREPARRLIQAARDLDRVRAGTAVRSLDRLGQVARRGVAPAGGREVRGRHGEGRRDASRRGDEHDTGAHQHRHDRAPHTQTPAPLLRSPERRIQPFARDATGTIDCR